MQLFSTDFLVLFVSWSLPQSVTRTCYEKANEGGVAAGPRPASLDPGGDPGTCAAAATAVELHPKSSYSSGTAWTLYLIATHLTGGGQNNKSDDNYI